MYLLTYLLAHPPPGTGVPYNYFQRGVQNWLTFQQVHAYNFGGSRSSLTILCDMTGLKVGMSSLMYKFLWACTPEIWESQKFENLARFRTTFDFDCKYLRNPSRYQKSETNLIDIYSCWVQQKNFGELWSNNKKVTCTDVDLL